jgi:hypothetical protein
VEGESEQSFFTWLQILSQCELPIHLETFLLGGGGFKSMLAKTLRQHKRRCRISGVYQERFLVVDGDRAEQGDWSIEALRREAAIHKFTVCAQNPNHEGLLLKMIPGIERTTLTASRGAKKLQRHLARLSKTNERPVLRTTVLSGGSFASGNNRTGFRSSAEKDWINALMTPLIATGSFQV